eukprot:847451_1
MGRKKITIQPIEHASTRRSTFEKRRIGLLKKAMELSILCKSTISLTIYTSEGDVYVYASEPYENVVEKFQNYSGRYRLLTNEHLEQLVPSKSSSSSVGFEIIKQPSGVTPNANIVMPTIGHPSSGTINSSSTYGSRGQSPGIYSLGIHTMWEAIRSLGLKIENKERNEPATKEDVHEPPQRKQNTDNIWRKLSSANADQSDRSNELKQIAMEIESNCRKMFGKDEKGYVAKLRDICWHLGKNKEISLTLHSHLHLQHDFVMLTLQILIP